MAQTFIVTLILLGQEEDRVSAGAVCIGSVRGDTNVKVLQQSRIPRPAWVATWHGPCIHSSSNNAHTMPLNITLNNVPSNLLSTGNPNCSKLHPPSKQCNKFP